jgi:hypothetical protein
MCCVNSFGHVGISLLGRSVIPGIRTMLVCGRINLYSCQEYSRRTEDQLESK